MLTSLDRFGPPELLLLGISLAMVAAIVVLFRQQRTYREHLAKVERINSEIHAMNRENQVLARESVTALKAIQKLLEDRKP